MQKNKPLSSNFGHLLIIGISVGILFSYSEIKPLLSSEIEWGKVLTLSGSMTLSLYILIALMGLTSLMIGWWKPQTFQGIAEKLASWHWILTFFLIAFLTWVYLFSPWQTILIMPWTQFVFVVLLAHLIAWILSAEQDQFFGWRELFLAFGLFLYPRIVQELRIVYPAPWLTRGAILSGFIFLLGLIYIFYRPFGEILHGRLLNLRLRLMPLRRILIVLVLLGPLLYRYMIGAGGYVLYPNIRFAVLLVSLCLAAYLLCKEANDLVTLESLTISLGWLLLVSAITRSLLLVVNIPFSLYWSEGNRLYDYSLIFGQDLYNHPGYIPNPYNSPGRYGLWGVLYLLQGLPIWVHRLWNVLLLTVPSFVLSWALTRKMQNDFLRIVSFLWIVAFFIILAPLHPPFMIVLIIVSLFAFHPSPYVRGLSLIAASFYAGISRWTWAFAPGALGALIDLLLYYPKREGNWAKRLFPSILMGMLGALPGFLLNIGEFLGYSKGENLTSQQPLLWYRLLPNSTLGTGIVLLILLTTGPLLCLLIYKLLSRQWKFDVWQSLGVFGSLLGFFTVGLMISTKIGGGGDLHNLDMYIGVVIIVISILLTLEFQDPARAYWPSWTVALLCFILLFPAYRFTPFSPSAADDSSLDIPVRADVDKALSQIRVSVEESSTHGEVLFMDQRQLLTFGYMPAIPFVAEYEKKYMMDQAMASNKAYFLPYYQDLADQRFALIVTEPLKEGLKDSGPFSEENDLWVIWVSAPTLCFYEPVMTDKTVGVQMLIPREDASGCEKYLQ